MRLSGLAVAVASIAGICAVLIAATEDAPLDLGLEEQTRVNRVIWPFFVAGPPDICKRIDASAIRVTEDREDVSVESALLIDTSGSVKPDHLRAIKKAAKEYIRSLGSNPRQDRLMVLSYDFDLILRAPLTRLSEPTAQETLLAAVDAIPPTPYGTDHIGALYQLMRYLREYPERCVVILLSDGGGAFSMTSRLRDEQEGMEDGESPSIFNVNSNITVFAIGWISLGSDGAQRLRAMAQESGGEFFRARNLQRLREVFTSVRERLEQEAFVTYQPNPSRATNVDVKITLRGGDASLREFRKNCDITAYRRRRFVTPFESRPMELPAVSLQEQNSALLYLWDVVQDGGATPASLAAGPFVSFDARPVRRWRWERLAVPPRSGDAGEFTPLELEDIFQGFLLEGIDPFVALKPGRGGNPPIYQMISGQTFLEWRTAIGRRVLETSDDHREFAEGKMAAEVERYLRNNLSAEHLEDPAILPQLVASLLNDPSDEVLQHQWLALGGWLDDITARELALRLELKNADGLLVTREASYERAHEIVGTIRQRWPQFHAQLSKPRPTRIVTPLVLAYDELRDQFGLYRLVLPRVVSPGTAEELRPRDRVPQQPLGLDSLLYVMEDGTVAEELRANWRVETIKHETLSPEATERLFPIDEQDRKILEAEENPDELLWASVEFAPRGKRDRAVLETVWRRSPQSEAEMHCVITTERDDSLNIASLVSGAETTLNIPSCDEVTRPGL